MGRQRRTGQFKGTFWQLYLISRVKMYLKPGKSESGLIAEGRDGEKSLGIA